MVDFCGWIVVLLNMLFHATRTCKGVGQDVILKYGQCNSDTSCIVKKIKIEGPEQHIKGKVSLASFR